MKRVSAVLWSFALVCQVVGCAYTQPGPSISSLGAGSDSAYLNGTRGRYDAQITRDQAEQYSRQRQQVREEMELEEQKRKNSVNNVNDTIRTITSFSNLIRY
jgi:hypothetical protein